jgi:hypothetical protein
MAQWLPVLTTILGACIVLITEALRDRRTSERERAARAETRRLQLLERRTTFQRQNLLDLQEALLQLARTTGQMQIYDIKAYRNTGTWQKNLYPPELDEANRVANTRTSMLGVRVRDNAVRDLLEQFKSCSAGVIMSRSAEESDRSSKNVVAVLEKLQQRIGEVLRTLDDEEAN